MKRILACLITGLFMVGVTGMAQAAGEFQAEGLAKKYDSASKPIPTQVVLDQGSRYIEGMGFPSHAKAMKVVVVKVPNQRDWCCEGLN